MVVLAVIGVLTSVVGAYYYLRIVKIMYFDEPAEQLDKGIGASLGVVMTVAAIIIAIVTLIPSPLVDARGRRGRNPVRGLTLAGALRLHRFDRLGSTNDEAKRLAARGEGHGTAVMAGEQTAGRGRRGRSWFSPPGNLHCSDPSRSRSGTGARLRAGLRRRGGLAPGAGRTRARRPIRLQMAQRHPVRRRQDRRHVARNRPAPG